MTCGASQDRKPFERNTSQAPHCLLRTRSRQRPRGAQGGWVGAARGRLQHQPAGKLSGLEGPGTPSCQVLRQMYFISR